MLMKTYRNNVSNRTRFLIILICLLLLFCIAGLAKVVILALIGLFGYAFWRKVNARA